MGGHPLDARPLHWFDLVLLIQGRKVSQIEKGVEHPVTTRLSYDARQRGVKREWPVFHHRYAASLSLLVEELAQGLHAALDKGGGGDPQTAQKLSDLG